MHDDLEARREAAEREAERLTAEANRGRPVGTIRAAIAGRSGCRPTSCAC